MSPDLFFYLFFWTHEGSIRPLDGAAPLHAAQTGTLPRRMLPLGTVGNISTSKRLPTFQQKVLFFRPLFTVKVNSSN